MPGEMNVGNLTASVSVDLSGLMSGLNASRAQFDKVGAQAKAASDTATQAMKPAVDAMAKITAATAEATAGYQKMAASGLAGVKDLQKESIKAAEATAKSFDAPTRAVKKMKEETKGLVDTLKGMKLDEGARSVLGITMGLQMAQRVSGAIAQVGAASGNRSTQQAASVAGTATEIAMGAAVGGPLGAAAAAIGSVVQKIAEHFTDVAQQAEELAQRLYETQQALNEQTMQAVGAAHAAGAQAAQFFRARAAGTSPEFEAAKSALEDAKKLANAPGSQGSQFEAIKSQKDAVEAQVKAARAAQDLVSRRRLELAPDVGHRQASDGSLGLSAETLHLAHSLPDLEDKLKSLGSRLENTQSSSTKDAGVLKEAQARFDAAQALQAESDARTKMTLALGAAQISFQKAGTWQAALDSANASFQAIGAMAKEMAAKGILSDDQKQQFAQQQSQALFSGQQGAIGAFSSRTSVGLAIATQALQDSAGVGVASASEALGDALMAAQSDLKNLADRIQKESGGKIPEALAKAISETSRTLTMGVRSSSSAKSLEGLGLNVADVQRQHGNVIGASGSGELKATLAALDEILAKALGNSDLTKSQRETFTRTVADQKNAAVGAGVSYIGAHATTPFQAPASMAEFVVDIEVTKQALAQLAEVTKSATVPIPEAITLQTQLNKSLRELQSGAAFAAQHLGPTGPLAGALEALKGSLGGLGAFGEIGGIALAAQQKSQDIAAQAHDTIAKMQHATPAAIGEANDNASAAQGAVVGGALTAGLMVILQRSRQFQNIVGMLNHSADMLARGLGPILQSVEPFVVELMNGIGMLAGSFASFTPIFNVFGEVFLFVGKVVATVFGAVAIAVDGVMIAFDRIAAGLFDFAAWIAGALGMKDVAKLAHDMSVGFAHAAEDAWTNMQQVIAGTGKLWNDSVQSTVNTANQFNSALGQAAESLNQLSGYLEGRAIFDAAQTNAPVGRHAAGGTVWGPQLSWIGEGGEPEDIVPHSKRGQYLSHLGGGEGGNGGTIVTMEIHNISLPDVKDAEGFVQSMLGHASDALGSLRPAPRFVGNGT